MSTLNYFNNRTLFCNRGELSMVSNIDILNTRANNFNNFIPFLENKNILDVGGCDGRWGAWCLDNGAKHVYGFDISLLYTEQANLLLSSIFEKDKFTYITSSWQDYTPTTQIDVVLLFGILYFQQPQPLIEKMCSISNTILVDTSYNCNIVNGDYFITLEHIINSFQQLGYSILHENNDATNTRINFVAKK